MANDKLPSWLKRAFDPSTPMTDDNETMRTIDVEIDGKMYLVPTIRMGEDGKLYKLKDKEAIKKAEELGDALLVPEGLDPTAFSKALSDIVPQRKARGGEIMANPMTEAQAAPQGNAPKAGNPATLMPPPPVPKPKAGPGTDPRDEAIQLVMQQSQKKQAQKPPTPPTPPTSPAPPAPLTSDSLVAQGAQGLAAPALDMMPPEKPMMAKRGGTKTDKEGMSVVIGLGSSPMPAYEEASMGTPKDPPPGATADEVADDQHVLMSEGELVVPANVVRYHGLGTYEGLRQKALMGLSEMENSGQINYDTGIKKANKGLVNTSNTNNTRRVNALPGMGPFPGYMSPYPYLPYPPSNPLTLAYAPVTNPNAPIVAPNVGSYTDIINPEEDDGAPEAPKVTTTLAPLVEPPKVDPRDDATSPQSMAQARADMDRSYDSAVTQAIAAGFTTPEEIALYIQGGNIKANTPLGSFGLPGFLFNNAERPDGTRPIDEAVKRYYQSDVAKARKEAPPEEISIDEALSKKVDEGSFPGEEVNTQTQQILAQQAEEPYTLYRDEDYGAPIKPKPEPEPRTVVKRDPVQGTTIESKHEDSKPVTITTGTGGKILGVNLGKEEKEEKQEKDEKCVIATHGVANGGFSPMEKAKAEIWCEKTYHGKWYGEAFRRGYRYLAGKHVEQDTASQFYQEFKDFVSFGRGLKKGLKLRLNYYFRTVQFFITGLFVSKDI